MKKIMCFITTMSSGGAEHQLAELTSLLVEKGYDVSIVTFADSTDHYVVNKCVKRIKLGYRKNNLVKFLSIIHFFIRVKTDCVISFGQRENMLLLFPMLFRRRIKVIAGERNFTLGNSNWIEKILLNFLYRRANYIVPNSYSQTKYILSKKPEYKSKVFTITNYTDLNVYSPSKRPHNEVTRIVVFCRYAMQKNYVRFAKAIQIINERCSIPFVVNWYGNIKIRDVSINPHYLHFKELLKEYGLEDKCILHDHTSDVNAIMSESDVFCLPSLFEGFSNSLSEAICCGIPVLTSDVSDNSIMTHDHVNGYLFNPYDVESIADAIIRYLTLPKEVQDLMAIQSRKIAVSLFDRDEFVNKYIKLIEQH